MRRSLSLQVLLQWNLEQDCLKSSYSVCRLQTVPKKFYILMLTFASDVRSTNMWGAVSVAQNLLLNHLAMDAPSLTRHTLLNHPCFMHHWLPNSRHLTSRSGRVQVIELMQKSEHGNWCPAMSRVRDDLSHRRQGYFYFWTDVFDVISSEKKRSDDNWLLLIDAVTWHNTKPFRVLNAQDIEEVGEKEKKDKIMVGEE